MAERRSISLNALVNDSNDYENPGGLIASGDSEFNKEPAVIQSSQTRKAFKKTKEDIKKNKFNVKISFVIEFVALILIVVAWVTIDLKRQLDGESEMDDKS